MKTLKWLWLAALLTICFKTYNMVSAGPNGYSPSDMESFVGIIFVFALISIALIFFWIVGRAKDKFSGKAAGKNL